MALVAAGMPALLAYNLPPSATLFNQATAFVGWAAFALIAATGSTHTSRAVTRALLGVCIAVCAIFTVTTLELERRESLTLSMLGTLAAVAVMLGAGALALGLGAAKRGTPPGAGSALR
mgnify:CR=1 FL=1